jgi:hypothetical protein
MWESDPRTADRAADFQRLVIRVIEKMRIMRSVLQFIPRRKFSNHTIADMDANMVRMSEYMKDSANRTEAKRKLAPTASADECSSPPPAKRFCDRKIKDN